MMIMAALRPPLHQRAAAAAAPVARWSAWPLLAFVLVAASVAEAGVLVGSAQAGGADLAGYSSTSTWDSSPFNLGSITDNNLGLLAKSCSDKFCQAGVDGLDLWVSFEEVSKNKWLAKRQQRAERGDPSFRVGLALALGVGVAHKSATMFRSHFFLRVWFCSAGASSGMIGPYLYVQYM
ncbi:unnamed protein product [Ectocarpus sp. 8 AP-2014]